MDEAHPRLFITLDTSILADYIFLSLPHYFSSSQSKQINNTASSLTPSLNADLSGLHHDALSTRSSCDRTRGKNTGPDDLRTRIVSCCSSRARGIAAHHSSHLHLSLPVDLELKIIRIRRCFVPCWHLSRHTTAAVDLCVAALCICHCPGIGDRACGGLQEPTSCCEVLHR